MKKLVVLFAAVGMLLCFTGCKMNRDDTQMQGGGSSSSMSSSTHGDTSGTQDGTGTPGSTAGGM